MTALVLDGNALAKDVLARTADRAGKLGREPGLAVILVGDDAASEIYVRNKLKRAGELGLATRCIRLPGAIAESEVLKQVERLNLDDAIDGILVQLPLPQGVNTLRVMAAIDPAKDVDGLHAMNAGLLSQGSEGLAPCTPLGCMQLIKTVAPDLTGLSAVVIGSSNIVGKPMAAMLLSERATVTVAHIHTRDTPFLCRGADILVCAAGKAGLVKGDWIKPRSIVIDVGINRIRRDDGSTQIIGDVVFDEAVNVAGAITPVPGGVGPMTIACLMSNTVEAAERRANAGRAAQVA